MQGSGSGSGGRNPPTGPGPSAATRSRPVGPARHPARGKHCGGFCMSRRPGRLGAGPGHRGPRTCPANGDDHRQGRGHPLGAVAIRTARPATAPDHRTDQRAVLSSPAAGPPPPAPASSDTCPHTGRARLSYTRAERSCPKCHRRGHPPPAGTLPADPPRRNGSPGPHADGLSGDGNPRTLGHYGPPQAPRPSPPPSPAKTPDADTDHGTREGPGEPIETGIRHLFCSITKGMALLRALT